MKYGVSDFFRNMELNPLFHIKGQKKILELQTKREYEFLGELPYYTGFEYEQYYEQIKNNPEFIGIMVWCQTGGWGKSSRITFLENSSPFVELNTISTLSIFQGKSAEQAVHAYFTESKEMPQFLEKYNSLSGKILYPGNGKTRYFRKLYIPPIIWLFWGNISINKFTASFVRFFYKNIRIEEAEFTELLELGNKCSIEEITFYIDTLKILYKTRLSFQGEYKTIEMEQEVAIYTSKYDILSFSLGNNKHSKILITAFYFMFRKGGKYRLIDRIFFNKTIILTIYKFFTLRKENALPEFAKKQATPIIEMFR